MPDLRTKVYIIDDEPSVCKAYERLARSANMEARMFSSIREFMDAEVTDENACIICDVTMPGISGLELPRMLKLAQRDIPVIFVTAHDTEETRATAQSSGSYGYFRKPVDDQALLDAIAWALGSKSGKNPKNI